MLLATVALMRICVAKENSVQTLNIFPEKRSLAVFQL